MKTNVILTAPISLDALSLTTYRNGLDIIANNDNKYWTIDGVDYSYNEIWQKDELKKLSQYLRSPNSFVKNWTTTISGRKNAQEIVRNNVGKRLSIGFSYDSELSHKENMVNIENATIEAYNTQL